MNGDSLSRCVGGCCCHGDVGVANGCNSLALTFDLCWNQAEQDKVEALERELEGARTDFKVN